MGPALILPVLPSPRCPQDGVDFLVAETADGLMDLADAYYFDSELQIYARPATSGQIPKGMRMVQVIPWIERRSADTLKAKPEMAKVRAARGLHTWAPSQRQSSSAAASPRARIPFPRGSLACHAGLPSRPYL
jgi:hypothetical protein